MLRKRWRWTIALAAVTLVFVLKVATEFLNYTVLHPRTRFEPRAVSEGTYYFLDWRSDFTPIGLLRESTTPEGPLRTTRAIEVDGRLLPDPIGIVQAGLALHDQVLSLPEGAPEWMERREVLRSQLEWLEGDGAIWLEGLPPPPAALRVLGDLAVFAAAESIPVWPVHWNAAKYGLDDVWISAMTQGQAISLFVRAAAMFDEPRYLEVARRAFHGFLQPDLPILRWDDAGRPRFEEYPTEPPSEVLNGSLCAALGVWDYARATGDSVAYRFADASLDALDEAGPIYEHGGWTRYDRFERRPTSPTYQEIHAALAEAVAQVTRRPSWRDRALRWRAAASDPWRRGRVFFEVAWDKLRIKVSGVRVPSRPVALPPRVLDAIDARTAG